MAGSIRSLRSALQARQRAILVRAGEAGEPDHVRARIAASFRVGPRAGPRGAAAPARPGVAARRSEACRRRVRGPEN